jgi:mono/diheme cytochrome c family protein
LSDEQLHHGSEHFDRMCAQCHGAPGVEPKEVGKGIRPKPPELARIARHLSDRELYWVIKHGIKFTGMPAFGPTHSDDELWALAAFVRRLPRTTPEQYAQLAAAKQEKAQSVAGGGSEAHH